MPKSAGSTPPSRRPKSRRANMARLPPMITTMPSTPAASPSIDAAPPAAIRAAGVSHAYGPRQALVNLSLDVQAGEICAVLGPNGGGKTTLFRLLSTLIPLQTGSASIFDYDLRHNPHEVRQLI